MEEIALVVNQLTCSANRFWWLGKAGSSGGMGGVGTEFNLATYNTSTCPENVDSLIGFTEPKK